MRGTVEIEQPTRSIVDRIATATVAFALTGVAKATKLKHSPTLSATASAENWLFENRIRPALGTPSDIVPAHQFATGAPRLTHSMIVAEFNSTVCHVDLAGIPISI